MASVTRVGKDDERFAGLDSLGLLVGTLELDELGHVTASVWMVLERELLPTSVELLSGARPRRAEHPERLGRAARLILQRQDLCIESCIYLGCPSAPVVEAERLSWRGRWWRTPRSWSAWLRLCRRWRGRRRWLRLPHPACPWWSGCWRRWVYVQRLWRRALASRGRHRPARVAVVDQLGRPRLDQKVRVCASSAHSSQCLKRVVANHHLLGLWLPVGGTFGAGGGERQGGLRGRL